MCKCRSEKEARKRFGTKEINVSHEVPRPLSVVSTDGQLLRVGPPGALERVNRAKCLWADPLPLSEPITPAPALIIADSST